MITTKEDNIFSLFRENKTLNNVPVLVTKLPVEVSDELLIIIENHKKIKDHKLSFLFETHNKNFNVYQISVRKPIVETTLIFPYLISLGQFYLYKYNNISFEKSHRKVLLRENTNHYDGYDLWINFSNKGNEIPNHTHLGALSGVIYIKNTENIPTIFNGKEKYYGKSNEIAIFPSNLNHEVEKQLEDYERITMSFNLYLKEI
jgi:hypothetical protein